MASTYSSNLKIELITTGEQTNTWGSTTNTNLGTALEEAIVGYGNPEFASDADLTISLTNSASSQVARNFVLNVTSSLSLTSTWNLIVPTVEKPYLIQNNTTGGQSIVVKTASGTGVTVPNGKSAFVYTDGTNVVSAVNHFPSITLGAALPVASGGTGLTSPGTSGNVLTSNGSAWASTALPATFTAGMIMLWSGSIGTIPSGWALCDGSNGTPNLQDRFVVGAGSSYSVGGTGGSTTTSAGGDHNHTGSTGSTTLTAAQIEHYHGIGTYDTDDDWYLPYTGRNWSDDTTMYVSLITGNSGRGPDTTITSGNASTSDVNLNNPSGHTHTISSSGTHTHTITPPYYALAYIMKL